MLLGFPLASLAEDTFQYRLVSRETVEARLREYAGTNAERGSRLKQMFAEVGCVENLSEQKVRFSSVPNVLCVLPGTTNRTIIVGAHFDRVAESAGVADNWSGASLLVSLYVSVSTEPRKHTYVFIGFTDEEKGLVGSRFYARHMTPEQVANTDAMVNMDTLGLSSTKVWASRSDKRLLGALLSVADYLKRPVSGINFERVGSTDSEAFAQRKIPRITIHSLTQKTEDAQILHTSKDKLSAMNLDDSYDTYLVLALYLVYLDSFLPESG